MKSKLALGLLGASSIVMLLTGGAVEAATTYTQYLSKIYLNGEDITNPTHIVAPDGGNQTSWIPIYYLETTLKNIGVTSTWNGSVWNLNVPTSFNPDVSNSVSQSVASNEMGIAINGTLVEIAPKIAAPDPSGGTVTTYGPIYYVMQTMKRMGIQYNWNGTDWTMTSSTSGTNTGGGSTSGSSETQQAMATAMWNVFNATTIDVNSHPSISTVGITPTTSAVTAGDVATWLADWASKAKGYTATAYGSTTSKFVPFSLQYESSTDPYTWAQENDLYQGTSVTSGSSVLSPSEATQVLSNLSWWLNGSKLVNGVYHLHAPMYGNFNNWTQMIQGKVLTEAQWEQAITEATQYYDEVTATVSGSYVNITLPNTSGSAAQILWSISDGSWNYGYQGLSISSQDYGGTTIKVPNSGPYLIINPQAYKGNLMGWLVGYKNVNGVPQFAQPIDSGNQQPSY